MSQSDLLVSVVTALNSAGVGYLLTGSFASSMQGEPRATHDVDIVLEVDARAPRALAQVLGAPRYYFDEVAAASALASQGMFQLLDLTTGDKVDFWALTEEPFDASRFQRRVNVEAFGVVLSISAPEDTILQKLKWSAASGGSERQLDDALGVYELQAGLLDESYLDEWAGRLAVSEELQRLRDSAVRADGA